MSSDQKESVKERARRLRREAYRKAKELQKARQKEFEEKVTRGLIEPPSEWVEREEKKRLQRERAKKARAERYQREKKKRLQEKEQSKPKRAAIDLSQELRRASELHELQQRAAQGRHLKLVE